MCGASDGRWMPGIDTESKYDAIDIARPTEEELRREMDRLVAIQLRNNS